MWKINKLYMKNFSHIYSGLDRNEISLDFTNNSNIINIFIGKMGSGKSAILGHLQPFATFGVLDNRNSDRQILSELDGEKLIEYSHNNDVYKIRHKYTWNKHTESHNTKSYIEYNGTELNPNGNNGSFKELIKLHFGIDQSFLRLIRLGPNVANFIDLKSTDRKSYIASLLEKADVYNILYKKLSDEMRNTNSKITVLGNKLMSLSVDKLEEMVENLDNLKEDISIMENDIIQYRDIITTNKTKNEMILKDKTLEEYKLYMIDVSNKIKELEDNISYMEKNMDQSSNMSIDDINKEIGSLSYLQRKINEDIFATQDNLKDINIEYEKLVDMKARSKSEDQLIALKNIQSQLQSKYDMYSNRLENFNCKYTYMYLNTFIDNLSIIDNLINEISSYNIEVLKTAYFGNMNTMRECDRKISILTGKKVNLQKSINNITYSNNYEAVCNMYRPPFCPTKECLYYKTHPITIKKSDIVKHTDKIDRIKEEIDSVDIEIARYSDVPILFKRLSLLKNMWNESHIVLSNLDCIINSNLYEVLTNISKRTWYDRSKLVDVLESCKLREEFYDLSENLNKTNIEIIQLENSSSINIEDKIKDNRDRYNTNISLLEKLSNDKTENVNNLKIHEDLLVAAQNLALYKDSITQSKGNHESLINELSNIKENIDDIIDRNAIIENIGYNLKELEIRHSMSINKRDELSHIIDDIEYTKKEFDEISKDKEVLKYILSATSSKDGIPLVLVKIFLDNCKDMVNDLISDVFGNSIEILDFSIDENNNEFNIPYIVNDMVIDDISSASQGQKAIISIALSFALIRQVQIESNNDYNIMLLDEMDGPLHSKDRDKFITILFKQLKEINARQVFVISHNNTFEGNPVNVIMTTEEIVDKNNTQNIYRLY